MADFPRIQGGPQMVHEGDPLGLLNPEGEIESCEIGISISGGGSGVRPAEVGGRVESVATKDCLSHPDDNFHNNCCDF